MPLTAQEREQAIKDYESVLASEGLTPETAKSPTLTHRHQQHVKWARDYALAQAKRRMERRETSARQEAEARVWFEERGVKPATNHEEFAALLRSV